MKRLPSLLLMLPCLALLANCASHTQTGILAGAGAGAVISTGQNDEPEDVVRKTALGALIGGALGAIADSMESRRDPQPNTRNPRPRATEKSNSKTQSPVPDRSGAYLIATKTERAGHVISPHPPHKVIDVGSYQSGDAVRDPSSGKIFRVP